MKAKISTLAVFFLLLVCSSVKSQDIAGKNAAPQPEKVTISCTPDLYPMASQWPSEYGRVRPEVNIKLIEVTYNKVAQGTEDNLRFVSTIFQTSMVDEANWKMIIGRDVIVPVINSGNPYLSDLLKHGVSQEKFVQIFNNPDKQNWGLLLTEEQNAAVHIFMTDNESVKAGVTKFIQSGQIPVNGITIGTKEEVIYSIQKDPLAIGFCKVVDVLGENNQGLAENIKLLPIDKNGNGTIDYMEDIYADANAFLRGLWIGKYPKALYSNIYAVSKEQPATEAEISFLSWVLTDGQQFMSSNGYCSLANTESQAQLNKISTSVVNIAPANETSSTGLMVLLVLAILITLGVIISTSIRHYRKQAIVTPDFNAYTENFDESHVNIPNGLYYDKSHTWAFMEKDGTVSVGIDDFLQHVTGPITRVEMKKPGEKIKKGDLLFSIIQIGKQLNLYAPVSGTIKTQNDAVLADSTLMNRSPYMDGWVYRIVPANWFKEIQFMEMADKYKRWINTEFSRVKDFLAATLKPDSPEYSHVVLQDGGVLKNGVLTDFGPEVWDDFQTNFLDTYK